MSIIDSFDNISREIISPQKAIQKIEGFPDTVITAFSREYSELLFSSYEMKQISRMVAGGIKIPGFKFQYKGKEIAFYQTLLGGAASGGLLEEIIAKGGKNVLFFGSCGSLDCLDVSEWNTGLLGKMPDDLFKSIMRIALETAVRL